MKCYVFVSNLRYLVLTYNCNPIYIESDTITIGTVVLKRRNPVKKCDVCYRNDYTDVVAFLLFGQPELGIDPPAPKGVLLIEDNCNIQKDLTRTKAKMKVKILEENSMHDMQRKLFSDIQQLFL